MKKNIIIILVVIVVIFVGGYFFLQKQNQAPEKYVGIVEKIKLAIVPQETSSLIYIAMAKGFFIDQGIDIELVNTQSGVESTEKLLKDEIDIDLASDTVLANYAVKNRELVAIASISENKVAELVAWKDKGINRPLDLKGKKIGVVKKSGGEYLLGIYLLSNNISTDQVEIIGGAPASLVADFSAGKLDAIALWSPHIFNLKKQFGDKVFSDSLQTTSFYWLAIEKKDKVKTDRDERFLRSLVTAQKYAVSNPEESKAIVAKKLTVSDDYINYYWSRCKYIVSLPQDLIYSMNNQGRWMLKETNPGQPIILPDYLENVDSSILKGVNPEAVTIIQ